jgi:hypothetical protein
MAASPNFFQFLKSGSPHHGIHSGRSIRHLVMFASNRQSSPTIRLIGGLIVVVFFGWFALPSCHCQWNGLFASGETSLVNGPDSAPGFDLADEPALPCHCDTCSDKNFEPTPSAPQTASPRISFSPMTNGSDQSLWSAPARRLTARGPPSSFLLVGHSEPRTFLRQRSLRL